MYYGSTILGKDDRVLNTLGVFCVSMCVNGREDAPLFMVHSSLLSHPVSQVKSCTYKEVSACDGYRVSITNVSLVVRGAVRVPPSRLEVIVRSLLSRLCRHRAVSF